MKKKLLITMGCSFTEGVGCWNLEQLPPNFSINHPKYREIFNLHRSYFHQFGWPNRLGMKMGYDLVINLGLGGSSTSGQVKQFFEKYVDKDFSDYDVVIVWLLTEPNRLSFYKNNKIFNISNNDKVIFESYIKFLSNSNNMDSDFIDEQLFYRKVIESTCKLKSYNFITFHAFQNEYSDLLTRKLNNINTHSDIRLESDILPKLNYISKICNHYNEVGYEMVANSMYDWISKNYSNIIYNSNDDIEWQWDGYCLNHSKLI